MSFEEEPSPQGAMPQSRKRRTRANKEDAPAKSNLVSVYDQMLEDMRTKEFVLFAPCSDRGLKHDYPELGDVKRSPEFDGVHKNDMLFAWAWACVTSPFQPIEDRDRKLRLCCKYAYPLDVYEGKIREYAIRFPENLAAAISKMGKYNFVARLEEYLSIRIARDNYKHIIAQDITKAQPWEKDDWLSQSIVAQKGMAEQRERIEGGMLGIRESRDTLHAEAVDLLSMYHESLS